MLTTVMCVIGYIVVLIIMILLRPRDIAPQKHQWIRGLSIVHLISSIIIVFCLAGLYQMLFLDNDIYARPVATGIFLYVISGISVVIAHYRFGEYPNEQGFNILASVVYSIPVAAMIMICLKQLLLVSL